MPDASFCSHWNALAPAPLTANVRPPATHYMADQAFNKTPNEEDVKRLAKADEMVLAIKIYREIHNVGVKLAKEAVEKLADLPRPLPRISTLALSPETQRRLEILFHVENRSEAMRLLVEECGNNVPFCEDSNERDMERIRFAALKLSGGDLSRLREAVELAKIDWRDLLVAAGFGDDVRAHEHWIPITV